MNAVNMGQVFQGNGPMPPTMAQARMSDHILNIERVSGGKKVPVPAGSKVKPGEGIYLTVTHIGSLIDPTVDFEVFQNGVVAPIFTISKAPAIGSSQVNVFWVAPEAEATYLVEAKLHSFPLLPKTHSVFTTFTVAADAPEPPKPPSGEWPDLKGLLIPAIILVGLVVLGPALARAIPSRKGD